MLPYTRNQSHPPNTPILGSTIDDLQDQAIAQYARTVTAPPKLNFPPGGGKGSGYTDNGFNVALGTGGGTNYFKCLELPVGARVKSVQIQGVGNNADDVNITIAKTLRATTTTLATATWSNVPGGAGGSTTVDVDEDDPDSTIAVGEVVSITFDGTTGAAIVIYGITVEIDFGT